MNKFICSCGTKVLSIRYRNGKKVCDICEPLSRSGLWERNNAMERQKYAKDILQPKNKDGTDNKDYLEVYAKRRKIK